MHTTKTQRRSGQSAKGDTEGFEDNLQLWTAVKTGNEVDSFPPLDAILRLREICHFARPRMLETSFLNDSQ